MSRKATQSDPCISAPVWRPLDGRTKAGRALRRQAKERAEIERGLLADLGRPATTNDRLACEDIAALTVLARDLERNGKFERAAKIRDQITRTRRTNNIKPEPVEAKNSDEWDQARTDAYLAEGTEV
jgi:hypothetical protein